MINSLLRINQYIYYIERKSAVEQLHHLQHIQAAQLLILYIAYYIYMHGCPTAAA